MKQTLTRFLAQRAELHSREIGWTSERHSVMPLSRDGAWYAGPLHVNSGIPVPGCARVLRYALRTHRADDAWFDALSVLVFSEAGALLARLNLPGAFTPERLRELDVHDLHLPLQCRLRLLVKTTCGRTLHAADKEVDSWVALAG